MSLRTQDNNILGSSDVSAFDSAPLGNDQVPPVDPNLLPLANYGGPTQTHALLNKKVATLTLNRAISKT